MTILILDTGPLGMVTKPKSTPENDAAAAWLKDHIDSGSRIIIPEIADYELRRELLLMNMKKSLLKLDELIGLVEYLPITTATMREAARCWAEARKQGRPTAHRHAIDGDMILVAQVRLLNDPESVIATVDVDDLSFFIAAKKWSEIKP